MTQEFVFNARQYFDFSQANEEMNDDSFFQMNTEDDPLEINPTDNTNGEVFERELSDTESDSMFMTPMEMPSSANISSSTVYLKSKLRKSLSLNNLDKSDNLRQALDELTIENNPEPIERPSSACSQPSKPSKTLSKERINQLSQPKRVFKSSDNLSKTPYMSLAEAVKKFQAGTPKRFRSKPSSPNVSKFAPLPWGGTQPHSPKLMTTQRSRPTNAISKVEQEKLEMEEAKKFKIKAHPVNKKILRGPMKPQVEHKPPTVIQPFKLTEVKKKEPAEPPKVAPFKAQPLPKCLNNPFKVQSMAPPPTKGHSPSFTKKLVRAKSLDVSTPQEAPKPAVKLTTTKLAPFSFEKRDQELQKKKEKFINKFLEEEKKAREFHAKPPPKYILKARNGSFDQMSDAGSTRSKKSNDELDTTIFKARPATVLLKKPFEPKKDENHDVVIEPFHFSTDERSEARQKFEQQLKEKEMRAETFKREHEEQMRKLEEEEIARLRKQAEHKAQPIKKYKEVPIKKEYKVTEPISPKFYTDRLRNKENIED